MSTSFLKKLYWFYVWNKTACFAYNIIMKKKKYKLSRISVDNLPSWYSNPTVQPDSKTEMGVPIPNEENVEQSKEYQEENEL